MKVPGYEYALGNARMNLGEYKEALLHFENFGKAGGTPPGLDPKLVPHARVEGGRKRERVRESESEWVRERE